MIGFLHGEVADINDTELHLDVHGVGYRITVPTSVRAAVERGRSARIHTSLIISDDRPNLYGFMSAQERDIFEILIKVSGIGPKGAVKMLSIPREQLVAAIQNGDIAVLTTVPGVGKKTAERVCLELRDKLGASFGGSVVPGIAPALAADDEVGAAMQGLQALGFSPSEIRAYINSIPEKEIKGSTAQKIITMCLKKRK
jgi:Holliday junction DNA helicase RuvA